jgi:hypothetical protein
MAAEICLRAKKVLLLGRFLSKSVKRRERRSRRLLLLLRELQLRTGHWRSAVYLKRIWKRADDWCWFCSGSAKMTRSHALLHCPNPKLRAARVEAWEGKTPGMGAVS